MKEEIHCGYCGGHMFKLAPRHKYCTPICATRGWRERNRDKVRAQDQRRYFKKLQRSRALKRERERRRKASA